MRRFPLLALVFALCAAVPSWAQDAPPPIVTTGLDAYRQRGPAAALDIWLQGWPAESQAQAKSQLLEVMEGIAEVAGAPAGYDYIGSASLGPHFRRVYAVLLHATRPAYLRLDIYQSQGEWRVLNVTVHTDPAEVFPAEMLVPRP